MPPLPHDALRAATDRTALPPEPTAKMAWKTCDPGLPPVLPQPPIGYHHKKVTILDQKSRRPRAITKAASRPAHL